MKALFVAAVALLATTSLALAHPQKLTDTQLQVVAAGSVHEGLGDIREGVGDIREGVRDIQRGNVLEGRIDIREGVGDIIEGAHDLNGRVR